MPRIRPSPTESPQVFCLYTNDDLGHGLRKGAQEETVIISGGVHSKVEPSEEQVRRVNSTPSPPVLVRSLLSRELDPIVAVHGRRHAWKFGAVSPRREISPRPQRELDQGTDVAFKLRAHARICMSGVLWSHRVFYSQHGTYYTTFMTLKRSRKPGHRWTCIFPEECSTWILMHVIFPSSISRPRRDRCYESPM